MESKKTEQTQAKASLLLNHRQGGWERGDQGSWAHLTCVTTQLCVEPPTADPEDFLHLCQSKSNSEHSLLAPNETNNPHPADRR